jgi:hypothetical protein
MSPTAAGHGQIAASATIPYNTHDNRHNNSSRPCGDDDDNVGDAFHRPLPMATLLHKKQQAK